MPWSAKPIWGRTEALSNSCQSGRSGCTWAQSRISLNQTTDQQQLAKQCVWNTIHRGSRIAWMELTGWVTGWKVLRRKPVWKCFFVKQKKKLIIIILLWLLPVSQVVFYVYTNRSDLHLGLLWLYSGINILHLYTFLISLSMPATTGTLPLKKTVSGCFLPHHLKMPAPAGRPLKGQTGLYRSR